MATERVPQETPRGIIGPDQWEIDDLANLPPSITKGRGPFSPRIAAASRIILGGLGFIVAGGATACYIAPQPVVEARAIQPSTEVPPTRTLTPIPPATETPKPTATVTSSATPSTTASETPSPSPTPIPTKEPTKTPTPEATPTPKPPEKSPLPTYGAFVGKSRNEQTGAEGMIMIASIPQKRGDQVVDQIAIYYWERDIQYKNKIYTDAYPLDLETVQDNNFEAISGKRTYVLKASWDEATQTLNGTFTITTKPAGQLKITVRSFKAELTGTGKAKVLETAKKMKLAQGKYPNTNWTNLRVDEFEGEITLPSNP